MESDAIKYVVENYRKSGIQSEAEVSSKFIIPLFQALGYPDELFAQEFPVYGYSGRDALKAKNADFIYFRDINFAMHRERKQADIKWVQDNSLLVIESKKPGKIPDDMGQAQFYSAWTKSVAYVVTDGELFRAFFRNDINADVEIIDTTVESLPDTLELICLDYQHLLKVKNESNSVIEKKLIGLKEEETRIIPEDEELDLPEDTISYIRHCLGKNAEGLTNTQALSRFLNTTDCYLANDMRYDIPEYMIDIPRGFFDAYIYLGNSVFPFVSGTIVEFYWNDEVRYHFESEYIEIGIRIVSDRIVEYQIGYHILDNTVDERISSFNLVRQVFDTKRVSILFDREDKKRILLPDSNKKNMWPNKDFAIGMFNFWYEGMQKLNEIEVYYDIKFKLKHVFEEEELNQLYESIDKVYDGIKLQENCSVYVPAESITEDIEIEFPTPFEENNHIPLETRIIQGVTFKPFRSTLLPCKIKKGGQGIVEIPASCEYIVEK